MRDAEEIRSHFVRLWKEGKSQRNTGNAWKTCLYLKNIMKVLISCQTLLKKKKTIRIIQGNNIKILILFIFIGFDCYSFVCV